MSDYELRTPPGYKPAAHDEATERAQTPPAQSMRREWEAAFWKRFPTGEVICIVIVCILCGLNVYILRTSDNVEVESWDVSPAVYLSTITTFIGVLLRWTFRRGATIAWWNEALAGSTLSDLHTMFNDRESLLATLNRDIRQWTFVRFASVAVTLLMATGPLLQQASYTTINEIDGRREIELPFRSEPLANLTTISAAPESIYQTEFNTIVDQYYNRTLVTIDSGLCRGNCSAPIVVAGFARQCEVRNVDAANMGLTEGATMFKVLPTISDDNEDHDLSINVWYRNSTNINEEALNRLASGNSSLSNNLVWHSCNLTQAYRRINITINDQAVSLGTNAEPFSNFATVQQLSRNDFNWSGHYGFGLMLIDNFVSSVAWIVDDDDEGSPSFNGQAARTYIDRQNYDSALRSVLTWSDPMEDILHAVDDLSVRYAAAVIPTSRDRNNEYSEQIGSQEGMQEYINSQTRGARQTVTMNENAQVLVYAFNQLTMWMSVAITLAAVFGVSALLRGFWNLGRRVSLSPLEIGKAFRAPLFTGMGSNMAAREIAEQQHMGGVGVQYGVLNRGDHLGEPMLALDVTPAVEPPRKGDLFT